MDNIIVNKNDFIEHIRQWVVLDSQTKIIHEKTKAIRERKNDLNAKICNYAKQLAGQKVVIHSDHYSHI